jgi:DNA-directed RNA polymerase specialized sigma24 family protein
MGDLDLLAERFEAERTRLRAVAYRMLGSVGEAEDAVQEAWFRLERSDLSEVRNLPAWLTTVVGRVCLDQLRTRRSRREDALECHVPDPVVGELGVVDPEQQALLADSVGLVGVPEDRAYSVMGVTVRDGRITEINLLADPDRLAGIDVSFLTG